jgi:hypothetical protein
LNFTADTEVELPVFDYTMGVSSEIVNGLCKKYFLKIIGR